MVYKGGSSDGDGVFLTPFALPNPIDYDLQEEQAAASSTMPDSIETDNGQPSRNDHFGPLALVQTAQSQLPTASSELQPGLHRAGPVEKSEIGNPAPLGLAGFALTTFVLGCINMGARDVTQPNMVVGVAFAYGGLVQLCAGMW